MVSCSSSASMSARPRSKIHGEEKTAAIARLEDLSSQSCWWYCMHGHVRGADGLISAAVCAFDPAACSARASVARRDNASERSMDCTATDTSLRLEGNSARSCSRPGFCLRRGLHSARCGDGHSRSADLGALAVAERMRGTDHRFDPAGLP